MRGSSLFDEHNIFSEYSLVLNSSSAINMQEVLDRVITSEYNISEFK
jgi:hypothetical protein